MSLVHQASSVSSLRPWLPSTGRRRYESFSPLGFVERHGSSPGDLYNKGVEVKELANHSLVICTLHVKFFINFVPMANLHVQYTYMYMYSVHVYTCTCTL